MSHLASPKKRASMNQWQRDVLAFHEATGSTVGMTIELRDRELRASLILEEAVETVAAMGFSAFASYSDPITSEDQSSSTFQTSKTGDTPNLLDVIDGICDSIYVLLGTAVAAGVDIEPFFMEVQRANMKKAEGPRRDDGKVLKPEDWTPPDHEKVMIREQAKVEEWNRLEAVWQNSGGGAG